MDGDFAGLFIFWHENKVVIKSGAKVRLTVKSENESETNACWKQDDYKVGLW